MRITARSHLQGTLLPFAAGLPPHGREVRVLRGGRAAGHRVPAPATSGGTRAASPRPWRPCCCGEPQRRRLGSFSLLASALRHRRSPVHSPRGSPLPLRGSFQRRHPPCCSSVPTQCPRLSARPCKETAGDGGVRGRIPHSTPIPWGSQPTPPPPKGSVQRGGSALKPAPKRSPYAASTTEPAAPRGVKAPRTVSRCLRQAHVPQVAHACGAAKGRAPPGKGTAKLVRGDCCRDEGRPRPRPGGPHGTAAPREGEAHLLSCLLCSAPGHTEGPAGVSLPVNLQRESTEREEPPTFPRSCRPGSAGSDPFLKRTPRNPPHGSFGTPPRQRLCLRAASSLPARRCRERFLAEGSQLKSPAPKNIRVS